MEMAFHIVINPPMNKEFGIEVIQIGRKVTYTLDACVSFVCILRLSWYLIRNMQHYSIWMSERADRVSGANGYSANTLFAIKMHLNLDPIKVLAFTFGLSLFAFSVLYYIAEVSQRDSGEYNRFENFQNAAWVASQNLLQAGVSGLEVPTTHLGMLVSVFCCSLSTVIMSMFIVQWFSITQMTPFEEEVFKQTK